MKFKRLANYKDYWAYKEMTEYGYKVEVNKDSVIIYYEDGDIYTNFKFNYDDESEFYLVYDCKGDLNSEGECINDELEEYDTYDEVVKQCLHYFWTRY